MLEDKVRELFSYLDIVECSDEGRYFRPNYISSCRCLQVPKMEEILVDMRNLVGLPPAQNVRHLNELEASDRSP
jgi:hypothetical protein